jgi:membrane associated rhomboid family serine protease
MAISQTANGGGVAYMAHVGGFVAGMVLVHFFAGRSMRPALG